MENRATNQRGIFRRLVPTLIVAIGVATLWALVVGWGAGTVETWTSTPNLAHEEVIVTRSGTPLTLYHPLGYFQDPSYRTLDGQPANLSGEGLLIPESLSPASKSPPVFDWPVGWGETLSTVDDNHPRGAWYLVRDDQPSGHAYLVGYDFGTNLLIGYIGRYGFQRGLPSRDEWFDVGRGSLSSVTASTRRLSFNAPAGAYESVENLGNLQRWLVYLIDGNHVVEINLQERSVREVFSIPDISSIAILTQVSETVPKEGGPQDKPIIQNRLAIRAGNNMALLNPSTGVSRQFALPESLRDELFQAYAYGEDQLLLYYPGRFVAGEPGKRLFWIDANGQITREQDVRLAQDEGSGKSANRFVDSIVVNGFVPVPIFWTAMLGVAPFSEYMEHRQPTYAVSFEKFFGEFWPALLVAVAIGFVSAWIVQRWQRKYFRSHTRAWCAFAFLLGLPGVAAYWLEMRRATLEACQDCHTMAPRDRDACASCRAPFPAPSLVGTELFA
jgi:hypothetical protein